jgi:hypothetical protein
MSAQTVIVIIAVVIIFILAARGLRGGPRVTDISRVVRKDKSENDR